MTLVLATAKFDTTSKLNMTLNEHNAYKSAYNTALKQMAGEVAVLEFSAFLYICGRLTVKRIISPSASSLKPLTARAEKTKSKNIF